MLRFRSALPISRSVRFSLLLILAGSVFVSPARAKKPKKSPTPPAEKEELGLKNIPLTVGHAAKGLVFPNYDLNGHLLGRFEAGTASRIDEQHVHFTDLKMLTYDEHEKPDFKVDMSDAVLNLDTRVIESKQRTKIKRADFEISGDAMRFNTGTHDGTLTGNVHMTLYNQSQLTGKPKS